MVNVACDFKKELVNAKDHFEGQRDRRKKRRINPDKLEPDYSTGKYGFCKRIFFKSERN